MMAYGPPGELVEGLPLKTRPDPPGVSTAAGRGLAVRDLTTRLARGEERAFETFHEQFFPRLYGYLLRLARGREDLARDAVQEAMLRVLRHVKPIAGETDLWRWLQRVARTAFIDLVRKEARWRRVLSPAAVDGAGQATITVELEAGMARLATEERELLERVYFEGQGHESIGRALGISAKAVESRLGRIRKKLRRYLIEELER